jgi:hypothetical protein
VKRNDLSLLGAEGKNGPHGLPAVRREARDRLAFLLLTASTRSSVDTTRRKAHRCAAGLELNLVHRLGSLTVFDSVGFGPKQALASLFTGP